MDFLKQVSIEIYPEGASDEERKSYSKKYGAQMHALLDAIRRKRIFPTKKRVGKRVLRREKRPG